MKRYALTLLALLTLALGISHAEIPEGFIKTWLLCGPFPNPPNKPPVEGQAHIYDHTEPCVGLATDYLKEHGGETKINPTVGMTHTRPDGTKVKWWEYTSKVDRIPFRVAITKESNTVAYAFTTVDAKSAGRYLLALGSDEGVCVWINSERVHYNLVERPIRADDDLVPVTFKKGKNSILIKVEQGWGGWGFILRIIPEDGLLTKVETDVDAMKITASLRKRATSRAQKIELKAGSKVVGEGQFDSDRESGLASETIELPFPPVGTEYGTLDIVIDGKKKDTLEVPSLAKQRFDAFKWETPRGYPATAFTGTELPSMDFERPLRVKELIGPYTISTKYYDAKYNEVTEAARPGRYAAVVDIKTATHSTRRFVTLYRQKDSFNWWHYKLKGDVALPQQLGIPERVAKDHHDHIMGFMKSQLAHSMERDQGAAILFSALHEAGQDGKKNSFYTSPDLRNRRWWLPLKRKLYGSDKKYPDPFVCPTELKGEPARVVRKGSLREAGMKKDFPKQMDKYLKTWEKDTDEAFALIVVRHGVIAFHKAYGKRDDRKMTLETKSWMASTTKMLSGTLMMMLVDQGLISLDDRAAKHLPPLRAHEEHWPATIHNLYRHIADLDGHWGSWFSDMEYRVADIAPYLQLKKSYRYEGAGMDLSCKILEIISGETLPDFCKNHLLDPLGCENTDFDDACGSADSVPLDMAKICQMLLQKGKYGNMRFFSEETFKQMLPVKVEEPNAPWDGYYGMGTGYFKGEGLGEGTFAHGAASKAFTRIDPQNDLVIVMTRNAAGENFNKYSKGFFEIIVAGLE